MKVLENGKYRDMTPEELAEMEAMSIEPSRKESIIAAIREVYSIDDEIAKLRQRDSKPDEFQAYFEFVEGIKKLYPNS